MKEGHLQQESVSFKLGLMVLYLSFPPFSVFAWCCSYQHQANTQLYSSMNKKGENRNDKRTQIPIFKRAF